MKKQVKYSTDVGEGFESTDEHSVLGFEQAWAQKALIDEFVATQNIQSETGKLKAVNAAFRFLHFLEAKRARVAPEIQRPLDIGEDGAIHGDDNCMTTPDFAAEDAKADDAPDPATVTAIGDAAKGAADVAKRLNKKGAAK